ncbi:MAG: PaaI family thioesterase [Acidimicrobiia bacterium]|nr:PaaI family thioesterase [Acidimicrobiia bacterium]
MSTPTESRLAAAAALRDLVNVFCGHDIGEEVLNRLAHVSEGLAGEIRGHPRWDRRAMLHAALAAVDEPSDRQDSAFVHRAVAGPANPTAIPFDLRREGDSVVTSVELGPAQEGAPGRAHGGVIAAIFDDLTGVIPVMLGSMSVTGRLTIHYRSPVPVETPVEFGAWLHHRDGRKLEVHAEARHGEAVLATAEALFVTIDFSRIDTDLGRGGEGASADATT